MGEEASASDSAFSSARRNLKASSRERDAWDDVDAGVDGSLGTAVAKARVAAVKAWREDDAHAKVD